MTEPVSNEWPPDPVWAASVDLHDLALESERDKAPRVVYRDLAWLAPRDEALEFVSASDPKERFFVIRWGSADVR